MSHQIPVHEKKNVYETKMYMKQRYTSNKTLYVKEKKRCTNETRTRCTSYHICFMKTQYMKQKIDIKQVPIYKTKDVMNL